MYSCAYSVSDSFTSIRYRIVAEAIAKKSTTFETGRSSYELSFVSIHLSDTRRRLVVDAIDKADILRSDRTL